MTGPADTIREALAEDSIWPDDPEMWGGKRRAALAALTELEQQLAALAAETNYWKHISRETADNLHDAIRRREARAETAEAALAAANERADQLADTLRALENAVRIYDVMLNEPAAEGLMSVEDYGAYLRGAWLGVEEAAEAARAALDRHNQETP